MEKCLIQIIHSLRKKLRPEELNGARIKYKMKQTC